MLNVLMDMTASVHLNTLAHTVEVRFRLKHHSGNNSLTLLNVIKSNLIIDK